MATIKITGQNAMDLDVRAKAMKILNNLPTKELDRLGMLADNAGAIKKFNDNWTMIKLMTGVK